MLSIKLRQDIQPFISSDLGFITPLRDIKNNYFMFFIGLPGFEIDVLFM